MYHPSAHINTPEGAGPRLPDQRTCAKIQTKFMSGLQSLPLCTLSSSVQRMLYPFKWVISTSVLVQDTSLWEADSGEAGCQNLENGLSFSRPQTVQPRPWILFAAFLTRLETERVIRIAEEL